MYQRILVPIDGSSTSTAGLGEAIRIAKMTGGQIRLIHVIDEVPAMQASAAMGAGTGDVFEVLRAEAEEIVEESRMLARRAGVPVETVLFDNLAERVSERIVSDAQAWKADLIVVGTHGRSGVGRMLLGSSAEQVARTSPVPVLLIRGPAVVKELLSHLKAIPVDVASAPVGVRSAR